MNKIKQSLFIIICLMSQISQAQKVSVMWNNLYASKFELLGGLNSIEMNGSYYCMAYQMKGIIGDLPYFLVKLDEKLAFKKSIEFPYKYNGSPLELVSITKGNSRIIVLFKYYENNGDNRYVLLKAVFDENLSNPLKLEKVEDIPTASNLALSHTLGLYYYNDDKDVIIMKVPREAYPDYSNYTFSSYDNTFSKKEWTIKMDLSKYANDYSITNGYFSENKEYIFTLKPKLKAFTKIKTEILLCKFTKENGFEITEINFEEKESSKNTNLFIDSKSESIYVYGLLEKKSSKDDNIFIKKYSINTLKQISNSTINLGNSKTNGLKTSNHDLNDFSFRGMSRDGKSDDLILVGEIYRNGSDRFVSGSILYLKIDNDCKLLDKKIIPRLLNVGRSEPHFGSFLGTKKDNKIYFLYYDSPKNENLTEYNNQIKVKSIPDNENQDLFMITIDENNKILKTKVNKTNLGNTNQLNKKQNFETLTNTYISPGKFLVMDGTNVGILTIE